MKKYETYKDSGVEWIGDIPAHWKILRLKHIGDSFIGLTYNPDDIVGENDNGVLVLRSSNIQNNSLALENNVFVNKDIPQKLRTRKGDILICSRNGSRHLIGKNICIDERVENCTFGAFMTIYRTEFWQFSYWIFNSQVFTAQSSLYLTSTINQLTQSTLNNLIVAYTENSEEQKSIAQYLDQKTTIIDTLLEKTKQKITTLQEQRTAIINQAVTKGLTHLPPAKGGTKGVPLKDSGVEWIGEIPESWFCPKKKYICEFVLDGTHSSFARVDEGGYRLLSVRNIINNKFVFREDDSRVSEEDFHSISSKFLIQEGDIQLAIVGATLGKVAIVEKMEELFVTQRSVATIRVKKEKCNNKFLFYFFNTSLFQRFLWQNTGFSAQPGIYLGTLQNINVPLPTKKEQEKIVDFLNHKTTQLDHLIQKEQQRIKLLKEYRQSLISEVVTGKRCVLNEIPVA